MARYVVRFMKDVLGENGHEAEICQRSMEIDAADKLHASDLAKVRFCKNESVKEWSLHADRVHVTEAAAKLTLTSTAEDLDRRTLTRG
jgi:hypothetical protein